MSQTNNPTPQQPTAQQPLPQQGVAPEPQVTAPQQSAAGQMAAPQQTPDGQQADIVGQGAPTQQGQIKDPEDWATGDQPMTDAQRSYLDSLAKQAGETLPGNLTKAQASEHIDRLQAATGRGQSQQN